MPEKEPLPQADGIQLSEQTFQVHKKDASTLFHFLETLRLFPLSDVKTFVIPETAFGLFGALSGPVMTTNGRADLLAIGSRIPHVILWTWLNALFFTLFKQRLPDAIKEDSINKPPRPIAAEEDQRRTNKQCGSSSSALQLFSSQFCDIKDQEGDQARGGKPVPLVLGDRPARWTVGVPVLAWSIGYHTFWSLQIYSFVTSIALGLVVAGRVLLTEVVAADRSTWKLWSLWLTFLYLLPVIKNHGFISGFQGAVTI